MIRDDNELDFGVLRSPRTFERRATAASISAGAMLFVLFVERRHSERRHQPPVPRDPVPPPEK